MLVPILSLVALAAAPQPKPKADPVREAQRWTTHMCRTFGTDAKNPWAMAHAVEVFGTGLKVPDGRLAIDAMVNDFAEKRGEGENTRWTFPRFRDGVPVDPHSNHTVMKLLRGGVPLMRVFQTRAGPVTLGELADSVKREFTYDPSDAFWREHAWTVIALATLTSEGAPSFVNGKGQSIDMHEVLDGAVSYLLEQHEFLAQAKAEGVAMVPKKKQFIWSHPCGGLHLVQAAFTWGKSPHFRKRYAAAAEKLVDLLFYRMEVETRTYDEAIAQAPEFALNLNIQRLKFYGHWLETITHLHEWGLFKLTPKRREQIGQVRDLLGMTVAALKKERAEERMLELKKEKNQLYLDLIGDSCHAAGALRDSGRLVRGS